MLTSEQIEELRANLIQGRAGVYSKHWTPGLAVSLVRGKFKISDAGGYLTATEDPSVLAELISLEASGLGTCRELLYGSIPEVWKQVTIQSIKPKRLSLADLDLEIDI